jgi:hypothetical protein
MKTTISVLSILASIFLAGLCNGRSAETNLPTPGAPATAEFKLSSPPPKQGLELQRAPLSASQSNAARLMMQRRAALIKDVREKQSHNTNSRPAVTLATNRTDLAKARLAELHRKQTDGTITEGERRQLQQLELKLPQIEKSNPPFGSGQAGPGDQSVKPER